MKKKKVCKHYYFDENEYCLLCNKKFFRNVDHKFVKVLFKPCPFCGEKPNVFEVPDNRYKDTVNKSYKGWVVECSNMGCTFGRSTPNRSFNNLKRDWNNRKDK